MNTEVVAKTNTATTEVDNRITTLRKQMQALNAERASTLPRISTEERELVVMAAHSVEMTAEGAKEVSDLRKNRQLTEEDRDQIAAAKLAHKRLINQPETKAEAAAKVASAYLHSYKLTHRKDGRVGVSVRGVI